MNYFLIIGISQGLLLALALLYKSSIKRNNAWLIGIFVLLTTAVIAGPLLNESLGEPKGSFLVDPLILLIGPSFYLYILSFSRSLRLRDLIQHGTPLVLYIPVLVFFYITRFSSPSPQLSFQAAYSSGLAVSIGSFKFLHLFAYIGFSFWALRQHRVKMKRVFANLEGKDLAWLRYMLGAFIVLTLVSLALYAAALHYPAHQYRLTLFNLSLLSVYILTLSFYAFHQNTLFDYAGDPAAARDMEQVVAEPEERPRYEKSGLKPEEAAEIAEKIEAFIQAKGYLNPEVTLGSMSEAIGVFPHKVSEVLGKHLNTSFYDLINRNRIEAIKQAIHDPAYAHLTLLSIAYDFGYNAKSTFNAAFKKFTGATPRDYKNLKN